ncbi:hypothetical protein SAMN04515668_5010 [Hymenobacter arizonensis]|uniref:Uncharacterized protein n=1 Tax=Hymenobacter arizonensis TaxID=1227077 RepID=A0A1I6BRS8_HYMAR|nr:hypothetical protein SAMN04515668_5010 [Hymenobacter arizonensis]
MIELFVDTDNVFHSHEFCQVYATCNSKANSDRNRPAIE